MIDENELYTGLMNLADEPESGFYYVDQLWNEQRYRIFLYRITSYSYWQWPYARYSRGTVFQFRDGQWHLVSLCMPKFFNLCENPAAIQPDELDDLEYIQVAEKHDGSLITVFRNLDNELMVKSKGSFHSGQANAARILIASDTGLRERIEWNVYAHGQDRTSLNFEYVAPDNFIVLRYEKSELKLLNKINHKTGDLTPMSETFHDANTFDWREVSDWRGKEGVVIYVGDPRTACKIKSDWYLNLHKVRDDITNPVKVAAAVLDESVDDMKSAFPEFRDWIQTVEKYVVHWHNQVYASMKAVDTVIETHRHRDDMKKQVALDCQQIKEELFPDHKDIQGLFFTSAMCKMNGKDMPKDKIVKTLCEKSKAITSSEMEKYKL